MSPEAQHRASQRRQCTGKRRLRDREEANRVRKSCENVRGERLRVYDCPFCQGFHLTSKEEWR